jgi:hypothetical protein
MTGLEGDGEGELASARARAARRFCMAVMGVDGAAIADGVEGGGLPGADVLVEDVAVSVVRTGGGVVNAAGAGVVEVAIAGCVSGLDMVVVWCCRFKWWWLCSSKVDVQEEVSSLLKDLWIYTPSSTMCLVNVCRKFQQRASCRLVRKSG